MTGYDSHETRQDNEWRTGNEYTGPSGEECPFCSRELIWDGTVLYCDNCEAAWRNPADLVADRAAIAAFEDIQP